MKSARGKSFTSQTIYYDIGDERDLTPEEVEGLLLEDAK